MKKIIAVLLAVVMVMALAACGATQPAETTGTAPQTNGQNAEAQKYTIGICQLVPHEALDAATQGFKDAVVEALGEENVVFEEQNAAGDTATCNSIVTGFVNDDVDLIMANATPALQAAAAATGDIPVLGTSVTEYGVALDIDNFTGTVGTNVSGTSDLAPLDQQADMITEWFPEAQNVGLVYCSAEANSQYQVDMVKQLLETKGLTATLYPFADSNEMQAVVQKAADESDVIYVPTDNTVAASTGIVDDICQPAGVPVIAGEEGVCKGCGVATLSISYYDLGVATGKMAVKILTGEADVAQMPIEYAPATKKYNVAICEALGLTAPEGYVAIAAE